TATNWSWSRHKVELCAGPLARASLGGRLEAHATTPDCDLLSVRDDHRNEAASRRVIGAFPSATPKRCDVASSNCDVQVRAGTPQLFLVIGGSLQGGPIQDRSIEPGITQCGMAEINPSEVGSAEVRLAHVHPTQMCASELCPIQMGAPEVCFVE